MKRGTAIALGILGALVALYYATADDPAREVRTPWTIEEVPELNRLEIIPAEESVDSSEQASEGEGAEGGDEPDLIALEKRDGEWWLTAPIEAPAADDVESTIEETFGSALETDDLQFDPEKADEYGVSDAKGVAVSLYGEGSDDPAREVVVGRQISVEATGAERTYLRKPEQKRIYRARAGIGEFVRRGVDEFRSKSVFSADRKEISRLDFQLSDGTDFVVEKSDDRWEMLRPEVDWSVASDEVDSIVGTLSDLTANGFAPDAPLSELGLESPSVVLEVGVGEETKTLHVGRVDAPSGGEGDGGSAYYAKKPGEPYRYELSTYAGESLVAEPTDVRSKTPRPLDVTSFAGIEFPGEDAVVVEKEDGNWRLVRPRRDKTLKSERLQSRLEILSELTVKGFPDVSDAQAGLGVGADRVVIETGSKTYRLLIGDETGSDSDDRYVKFADGDEVYTVTGHTADELYVKADDLVRSPGGPAGRKGGMGGKGMMQKLKGMKGGGGLGR